MSPVRAEEGMQEQISGDPVLKNVIVYVEVRSSNDNRSKAVCDELEQLGARVEKKFTDDVTHVIYKEGTKRTREKAQKKGIHLVSVLWVECCRQKKKHVSEKLFPANLPDPKTPPLYLNKHKKGKCMQPRDFEDDLARMSEKCNKRRNRNLLMEKWKMAHGTPTGFSPKHILVEDTQPRTPGYSSASSTPVSLTIPDTPPSMKARLESLKLAKQQQAELSVKNSLGQGSTPFGTGTIDPLPRKLFDGEDMPQPENNCDIKNVRCDNQTTQCEKREFQISAGNAPASEASKPGHELPVDQTENLPPKTPTQVKRRLNPLKRLLSLKESSPQQVLVGSDEQMGKGYTSSPMFARNKTQAASSKTRSLSCTAQSKGQKRKSCVDENILDKDACINPAKVHRICVTPVKSIPVEVTLDSLESGPCVRRSRRKSVHGPFPEVFTGCEEDKSRKSCTKDKRRHGALQDLCKDEVNAGNSSVGSGHLGSVSDQPGTWHKEDCANGDNSTSFSHPESTLTSRTVQQVTQSTLHGLSMSLAYGDSILSSTQANTTLPPPRPSIDEFKFSRKMSRKRATDKSLTTVSSWVSSRDITFSGGSDSRQGEDESGISSGTGSRLSPVKEKTSFTQSKPKKTAGKRQQREQVLSWSSSGSNSEAEKAEKTLEKSRTRGITHGQCRPKLKKSIVMTNLHTPEQEVVISVVKQLGEFYMTDTVDDKTTHVVCGESRRTLNVLHAITRGCWLLSYTWVLQSLEAGKWLDEEQYELGQEFPAAKLSRVEQQTSGGQYKKPLFASVGLIFICKRTKPPREHLVSLVHQCAGQVTTCQRKAKVIVGTEFHTDIVSVSPQWILDSITEFKLQTFDKYMTSQPKRQSSPEF